MALCALARQALWLLFMVSALSLSFVPAGSHAGHNRHPIYRPRPHMYVSPSTSQRRHAVRASSRYSRQATLMMAAYNPRIGLRSSLMGSVDTCHVDPVRMAIRPPRKYARVCSPTAEISFGCRGRCSSYSRVDVRNTSNVLRSCRPTGFGFRLVKMKCQGFSLRTTVKFALGCHCRPCLASVQSLDIHRLRDLLRSTSITSLG